MTIPQLHIGAGTHLGALTVFPVWSDAARSLGISTGRHASIEVTELAAGARVDTLSVTNRGSKPALLLEGELLEGGLQHRVCAADVVLAAGETRSITTFCVEQGRWGGTADHARSGRRAPLNVRIELRQDGRENHQRCVWERVARFEGLHASSATGSLAEHLDASSSRALSGRAQLPQPLEGQRGVVLGVGGQALMLELFGTATLFARHYRQLMEAVWMDVQLLGSSVAPVATPAQAARDVASRLMMSELQTFGMEEPIVRSHPDLYSRPFAIEEPGQSLSGIAVKRGKGGPQIAHLTAWNTRHPYALAA